MASDGPDLNWTDPGYAAATTPAPPKPYSSAIWPVSDDGQGGAQFDSNAGILGSLKRAVQLPARAMRGEFDPTSREAIPEMMEAAMVMSPISTATRAAGPVVSSGSKMGNALQSVRRNDYKVETPTGPSVKAIKAKATKLYDEVEHSGITVHGAAFDQMVSSLQTAMKTAGYHPRMHSKAAGAMDGISDYVGGSSVTMQDLAIVRRLAKAAKNSIDPDESRIGGVMLEHIDGNMRQIPGVMDKLTAADKLWHTAKKTKLLDEAVEAAKHAASGFENGLRIEFRRLLKKEREGKLVLTAEEKASMSAVVDGSIPANLLKGLGKIGPAPGSAGNALMAGIAGIAAYEYGGLGLSAAVAGTGYASRLAAQAVTKGAAGRARGVVSGAVPKQVYAPGPAKDAMLKALMAQGQRDDKGMVIDIYRNSGMRNALGAN